MCPASKWPQSDLLKASLTEARVTSVCPINILNCPNVNIRFSWIYSKFWTKSASKWPLNGL